MTIFNAIELEPGESGIRGAFFGPIKVYAGLNSVAAGEWLNISGVSQLGIQVTGIGTGNFEFQGTLQNLAAPTAVDMELKDVAGAQVANVSANGIFYFEAAPVLAIRPNVIDATGMVMDIWVFGRNF